MAWILITAQMVLITVKNEAPGREFNNYPGNYHHPLHPSNLLRILLRIFYYAFFYSFYYFPTRTTYWSTYIRPKNSSILLQPTSPYGCRISLCFCTPAYQTISTFLVTHPLGTGEAGTLRSKSSSRLTMSANRGPACET